MDLFWKIVSILLIGGLVILVIYFAIMATWLEVTEGVK